MMGIVAAFIIALIVAILFSPSQRSDSLMPLAILFLVLFFAGLSAQFWIIPFGPVLWGVAWLRIFFVILIFALLFSAPPAHRKLPVEKPDENIDQPAVTFISAFVWVLLFLLIVSIAVGLFYSDTLLVKQK